MGLTVSMTGSGTLGPVEAGWSITEEATPVAIGDSSGAITSATFRAGVKSDSRYCLDNAATMVSPAGTLLGRVSDLSVSGLGANVSVAGGLEFLVADRTMPPVWATSPLPFEFVVQGSATGQVATTAGIAVDPVDGAVYVGSRGTYGGVDRTRILKFSATGTFILEFATQGTAAGQLVGGSDFCIAVSPVDQSVYVSDPGSTNMINKWTSAGAYVTRYGTAGVGNGNFDLLYNYVPIAVDASGNLYAGDSGNDRVQKFNSSGVYQAQVAIGTAAINAMSVGNSTVYVALASVGAFDGRVLTFNTSLVLQSTLVLDAPEGLDSTGARRYVVSLAANADGAFWATFVLGTYVAKFSAAGVLQATHVGDVWASGNESIAVATGGTLYQLRSFPATVLVEPRVRAFNFAAVTLSTAIQTYMLACDSSLAGYTYSYTASSNPTVVFPAWSGNVWANLKQLAAAYGVEIAVTHSVGSELIVVRDVGSLTLTVPNHTVATTKPANVSGGQRIDITYQNPVIGGTVLWDAATEERTLTVAVAGTETFTFTSAHSLGFVQSPVCKTGTISPGQYAVKDSTGAAVSPTVWYASGARVTAALATDTHSVTVTIVGPPAAITGFTGPFTFAVGSVQSFSVVGEGVLVTPTIVQLATGADPLRVSEQAAQSINSPFIDTVTRAYDRGVWAAALAAGPSVQIEFDIPTASTGGLGRTIGALFTYEGSKYRVTNLIWGDLSVHVTAVRHTTLANYDTAWSGQTLTTRDAFWSGYSLGDRAIQPTLTAR